MIPTIHLHRASVENGTQGGRIAVISTHTTAQHHDVHDEHHQEMGLTINMATKIFQSAEGTEIRALNEVSLEIQPGEFFVMLGPSGCGKTTLLRAIAGLESLDAGEIYLGNTRIDEIPPYSRPVNTVFQSYALFPHLTVAENVAFGLEMEKMPRASIRHRVQEMLDLVHLGDRGARKPDQLSGGQQQRVALARALAKSPKVLLLDESLSALDFKLRRQMQDELKRIQRETGITFVFVTHDQEEALSMGDHIAVFSKGKPEQVGTPEEIYNKAVNRFVADGHAVTLAIRPENIMLHAPVASSMRGTIISQTFMGANLRCEVQLDDGSMALVRVPPPFNPDSFHEHAEVSLSIRPEHVRVVDQ